LVKTFQFTLVVAVLLMLPWLTSIAYGKSNSNSPGEGIRVEATDRAAVPQITFFGHAFGSVTPGDLFHIDATGSPHDLMVTLYITNAPELTRYLKYLILKVSVYPESEDGSWQQIQLQNNSMPQSSTYLTLQNSPVKFTLPGNDRYKVSLDSGSYYCLPARAGNDNEPPHFYLKAEPV
jgi:hypothetical protein